MSFKTWNWAFGFSCEEAALEFLKCFIIIIIIIIDFIFYSDSHNYWHSSLENTLHNYILFHSFLSALGSMVTENWFLYRGTRNNNMSKAHVSFIFCADLVLWVVNKFNFKLGSLRSLSRVALNLRISLTTLAGVI